MTDLNQLRRLAGRRSGTPHEAILPGLRIGRMAASHEPVPMLYEPMVCLVLSGSKRLYAGDEVIDYGEGQHLVLAVDMPVTAVVTACPVRGEYLAAVLKLDPNKIADLAAEMGLPTPPRGSSSLCVAESDEPLLDAWRRLFALADRPDEIPFMAPLVEREILYRLLRGPQGVALIRVASAEPEAQRIRAVAAWIRSHFAEPLAIEALAERANMSVSVFHRRFKETMRMSPLQYQKTLRLYEARARLLGSRRAAAGVAYAVGYESASQFSREYKRQFGVSPSEESARVMPAL